MGFFDKIKQGLTKTKTKMDAQLTGIFAAYEPGDEEFFEDLEETLILADTGVETTTKAIAQLRKAIELGCEASEFDVWLTKDKYIALNHDYEYDGMIVELSKLADMRRVILEQGEVMATLDEYLDIIRGQNRTRLVLELKSTPANKIGLELADAAVAMVHEMGAQAWVDYISFDYEVLKRVRALDPTAHIAYLGAVVPMDQQKIEGMSGIDYHFSQFDNMPRLYDRARMLGLTINVWTVDDPKIMERMLDMGVDFITTDEPAMLLEMIEKRNKR